MNLAGYIDHTLLKPGATVEDIIQLCKEAEQHQFAAVCVNPVYVDLAAHCLTGTGVKTKVAEAKEAVLRKANELDMVINIGAAKAGMWEVVTEDIRQVVAAADGATVKVIIETCLLTDDEKRRACQAVLDGGAQFVKTSTGFGSGGATVEDIRLFKQVVGDKIRIKASGGIRTREQAKEFIAAGATRLGTSAGIEIAGTDNKKD